MRKDPRIEIRRKELLRGKSRTGGFGKPPVTGVKGSVVR
jgi:hypothetical protein